MAWKTTQSLPPCKDGDCVVFQAIETNTETWTKATKCHCLLDGLRFVCGIWQRTPCRKEKFVLGGNNELEVSLKHPMDALSRAEKCFLVSSEVALLFGNNLVLLHLSGSKLCASEPRLIIALPSFPSKAKKDLLNWAAISSSRFKSIQRPHWISSLNRGRILTQQRSLSCVAAFGPPNENLMRISSKSYSFPSWWQSMHAALRVIEQAVCLWHVSAVRGETYRRDTSFYFCGARASTASKVDL